VYAASAAFAFGARAFLPLHDSQLLEGINRRQCEVANGLVNWISSSDQWMGA